MPPMMRSFSISSRTICPAGPAPGNGRHGCRAARRGAPAGSADPGADRRAGPPDARVAPTGEVEFEDHDVAGGERRRDRIGGGVDKAEIGRVVVVERGRDRDDERIRGLGAVGRAQLAQGRGRAQQHVEVGLGEIGLPGIDRSDDARVHVDPNHVDAAAGEGGGGRQADIAEADNTYRLDRIVHAATMPEPLPAARHPLYRGRRPPPLYKTARNGKPSCRIKLVKPSIPWRSTINWFASKIYAR